MRTILRFEKIKDYNSLKKAQYHHKRQTFVENATESISNINLIECDNYQETAETYFENYGIKVRKNSVIAMDCIMSLSPEYFKTQENLEEFKLRAKLFIKEEFGDNCISAVLHLDEKTPHVHAVILPVKKSGEIYRLSARTLFGKNQLYRFQNVYNQYFKDLGFSYKHKSKAKHKDIKEYYSEVNNYTSMKSEYIKLKSILLKERKYLTTTIERLKSQVLYWKNNHSKEEERYIIISKKLKALKHSIDKLTKSMRIELKKYNSIKEMEMVDTIEEIISYENALNELRFEIENNYNISDKEKTSESTKSKLKRSNKRKI